MTFLLQNLISLLSLAIAIWALVYTWLFNKYSIYVDNEVLDETYLSKAAPIEECSPMIQFSITNTSNRPIKITGITLYKKGKNISDNGFDHLKFDRKYFNDHLVMPPHIYKFSKEELLTPNEFVTYSFFLDTIPDEVVITSNKRIGILSREKSFTLNFDQ